MASLCSIQLSGSVRYKPSFVSVLRSVGIYVVEKGAIEAYHPDAEGSGCILPEGKELRAILNTGDGGVSVCDCIGCGKDNIPDFMPFLIKYFNRAAWCSNNESKY